MSSSRSLASTSPRRVRTRSMKRSCTSSWIAFSRATSSGFSGWNGSRITFESPGRVDAPLDADLAHQLDEAEAGGDDADRADDRGRVDDDLVAGAGDHVAAGGADILHEDEHRLFVLLGERADALVDQVRLHRRAARRIDHQRDCRRGLDAERLLQERRDRGERQARTGNATICPIVPESRTTGTTARSRRRPGKRRFRPSGRDSRHARAPVLARRSCRRKWRWREESRQSRSIARARREFRLPRRIASGARRPGSVRPGAGRGRA